MNGMNFATACRRSVCFGLRCCLHLFSTPQHPRRFIKMEMDSTLEATIKFVDVIRKHPVIYDRNRKSQDPGTGALNAAWNDVASQIGVTAEVCKNRWKNIHIVYSKYLKKTVSYMSPSGIEPYLSFLDPILMPGIGGGKLEDRPEYNVKLVNLVRERPCLYDGSQPDDWPVCWAEIAQRLQEDYPDSTVTAERCQNRWSVLRFAFDNYLKKGVRLRPRGIEEHLGFLTPHLTAHDRQLLISKKVIVTVDLFQAQKKFINLVKKHRCLYDGTDSVKFEAWKEVADALGNPVTPQSCSNRWLELRHAFERHLVDGRAMHPSGIEKLLDFLKPYIDVGESPAAKRRRMFDNTDEAYQQHKKFINLVKIHPCLYDGTGSVKFDDWKKVSDAMGRSATPQRCSNRWLELRHAFERHLEDGTVMYPPGIEQLLDFLVPYIDVEVKKPAVKMRRTLAHIPFHGTDLDVQFVMQFVDTMHEMNDSQKRRFRVEAVRLAREILGE